MDEGTLAKKIMKWQPKDRKKRDIPKLTWIDDIQTVMIQKRIHRGQLDFEDPLNLIFRRRKWKQYTTW